MSYLKYLIFQLWQYYALKWGSRQSLRQTHLKSNAGCDFKQISYLIITNIFFFSTVFYKNGGHIYTILLLDLINHSMLVYKELSLFIAFYCLIVCMYQNSFNQSLHDRHFCIYHKHLLIIILYFTSLYTPVGKTPRGEIYNRMCICNFGEDLWIGFLGLHL